MQDMCPRANEKEWIEMNSGALVGWSCDYASYYYTCAFGCHSTDYESRHEAEQAFLSHVCRSAGPS